MKTIATFLCFILVFPFTTAMAQTNMIILTAAQVTSARDIETAIETATAYGTRPGTVILDGSQGDFYYTGDDKSINLYYSNVTLQGDNGATLANCDDGIFFDDFPNEHILIEGITFVCRGNGIAGWGGKFILDRVIIRKNTIHAQGNGITMGSMKNWNILRSHLEAFAVLSIRASSRSLRYV